MTEIEHIKQKLSFIDSGAFQNLCDEYLSRRGYKNKMSLGSKEGTRKTTKGTPDTYFLTDEGKYIFVEYTTQQTGLVEKINSDIAKCLDISATGINHDEIEEIKYYHTSSNITPSSDKEIRKLCYDKGIKLELMGIDQLASELHLWDEVLVSKFLGIKLSTGQIQLIGDFVQEYNSSKQLAAPLDTEFMFRIKEISEIDNALQAENIVVLTGAAGVGKTKLALYLGEKYSDEEITCYCVHYKGLEVLDDMRSYFMNAKKYVVIIDDANHLTSLKYFIQFLLEKYRLCDIKIIVTVRDYALKEVEHSLLELAHCKTIKIEPFDDEEIKTLVKKEFGIVNEEFQKRIVQISEGNARIAILAAKLACKENGFNEIRDVTRLYESYYGSRIREQSIVDDKDMLVTMGVVAFFEVVRLDYLEYVELLLTEQEISEELFKDNIKKLHEMEYIDVYLDKATKISDQCLANYLLKYIIVDKRIVSLSTIIIKLFKTHKQRIITITNMLIGIFSNKEVCESIEIEIKRAWEYFSTKNDGDIFQEFVKTFYKVDPTKTLILLKNSIETVNVVERELFDEDLSVGKSFRRINDAHIIILSGFSNMSDLSTALDLFFQYFLKRPDLYVEFYYACIKAFGINMNSDEDEYHTQIIFLKKIKEYSKDWTSKNIALLFLEIAEKFLEVYFSPTEGGRKNRITLYQINLVLNKGVECYRNLIWKYILELCNLTIYNKYIYQILKSYGNHVADCSISVIRHDSQYVERILSFFEPINFENCALVEKIENLYLQLKIGTDSSCCYSVPIFKLYKLLTGSKYNSLGWEEKRLEQKKDIDEYVKLCTTVEELKLIIDSLVEQLNEKKHINSNIKSGLELVFDAAYEQQINYVELVEYYLEKKTPLNIQPEKYVYNLFTMCNEDEVYDLINKYEYNEKNSWLFAYFFTLNPTKGIKKGHVGQWLKFLSSDSDKLLNTVSSRDVIFLNKYEPVDKLIFKKSCEIIMTKKNYSKSIVSAYFGSLFDTVHITPENVIDKFNDSLELLEEIYSFMLDFDHSFDYEGEFIKVFYDYKKSILDIYIEFILKISSGRNLDTVRLNNCFWDLENYISIYDEILENFVMSCGYARSKVESYLELILLQKDVNENCNDKREHWIEHSIEMYWKDPRKMNNIFEVITRMSKEKQKQYVAYFLRVTDSYEAFKTIGLVPRGYSTTGDCVNTYLKWIEYLESLLPLFIGITWIEHKKRVEDEINKLMKMIKEAEVRKFISE